MDGISSLPSDIEWDGCLPDDVSLDNGTLSQGSGRPDGLRLLSFGVSVTGCLANVALLVVLLRHKSMHDSTNIYVASLAIADVLFLVLGAFGMVTDILGYLPRNLLGCSYLVLTTVPYYSGLLMVSLLTLDRYYAICHPLKHRVVSCKKRSLKLSAVAWCGSLLYSSLTNLENGLAGNGCQALVRTPRSSCKPTDEPDQPLIFSDILRPLPLIVLLFVNCLLYLKIIQTLRHCLRFRNHPAPSMPVWFRNIRQSRIRITRMLAVSTLVFFTCNTPRTMLVVVNYARAVLELPTSENRTVTVVASALLLLNSSINPLVYTLTNRKYRRAFREVFAPSRCSSTPADRRRNAVFHLQISD